MSHDVGQYALPVLVLVVLFVLVFGRREGRRSLFYQVYMRSWLWRLRRWIWYWTSNRHCEGCGRPMVLHRRGIRYQMGTPCMTVHHRNYRHLGRERRRDVELLCWGCHSAKDAWRFARRG